MDLQLSDQSHAVCSLNETLYILREACSGVAKILLWANTLQHLHKLSREVD